MTQVRHTAPTTDGSPYALHFRRTLKLAWPIIISRTGLALLFAVDTFITGQVSADELAGLAVGSAPMFTVMLVCLGAMQSTVVLSAQALGSHRLKDVGDIFRASIVNAVVLGLIAGLMSLWAYPFFLATGQSEAVATLSAKVSFHFAWGLPGLMMFLVGNLVLESTERPQVGMVVMVVANLANLALDGIFVLGWFNPAGPGGAVAAMATTSIVRWGMAIATLSALFVMARRAGDPHGVIGSPKLWLQSLVTLGGANGKAIRRMGLPMGLGQGVESAAFATMTLLAGALGATAVAAYQATMTVMSLVYMNSVGTGGATSIRVGNAVGRRFPIDLHRAGWSGILLGGLLSGAWGVLMIIFHEPLGRVMVEDPATAAIASTTMLMAGFFVAFDSMMGVSMGALRGLGDVWVPLILQSAAFWLVSVPMGWLMALHFGWGASGLYVGIGAGIAASLLLLVPRFKIAAKNTSSRWNS
ncbi:MATE family efflux transporter [Oryzibacter oryziterrae]|uniref:MATE family efflux transporter n=1 Tax=Oryzibacter oryziterrae TaxID=2766474 RepID=UPI001F01A50A|nr:MATE family efflux transporter [Oryzibacter oryziterrae]